MNTNELNDAQRELRMRVNVLLREAIEQGLTFTVQEIPLQPPRMGGKVPHVEVHVMTPTYRQQLGAFLAETEC